MKLTKKTLGRAAAAFLATAMLASFTAIPAFAAPATVSFTKTIDMTSAVGATVPNAIYSYSVEAGTPHAATETTPEIKAGVGSPTIANVVFTPADTITANKAAKTVNVNFSNVKFQSAGIYRYKITEKDPTVAGLATSEDDDVFYLDVYVTNVDGGDVEISSYMMLKDDNAVPTISNNKPAYDTGKKTTGDTDAYTTYTLTITKNVAGNMADMTKDFSIDVDFASLSAGTKVTSDGVASGAAGADGAVSVNKSNFKNNVSLEITGVPADAEYTVVENLSSNDGYTVTCTVDEVDKTVTYDSEEYSIEKQSVNEMNHEVVVTNTKTSSAPTGIVMNVAPYVLLVVVAAAGCLVFLRKRNNED